MATVYAIAVGSCLTVLMVITLALAVATLWTKCLSSQFRLLPKSTLAVLVVCGFCATMQAQKPTRYHVDANAIEDGDGTEERPFLDIQTAIDAHMAETNQFEVVVMPGQYGPVKCYKLPVSIVATTNSGERVIDGRDGEWAVSGGRAGVGVLRGFAVCNATNGVEGFTVCDCEICDISEAGVSNCAVVASKIDGCAVGAIGSYLSDVAVSDCSVGIFASAGQGCRIEGCDEAVVDCALTNSTIGGSVSIGAKDSIVCKCYVTNNLCCAASNSVVDTCLLADNNIGSVDCVIYGSTIAQNRRGGVFGKSVVCNSVIAYNKDGQRGYLNFSGNGISATNCCTSPLPEHGTNNVVCGVPIHPRTLKLRVSSPAIGAGSTNFVFCRTDLNGASRVYKGVVDIGAFNYRATRMSDCTTGTPVPVPYDWLKVKLKASYNDVKGKGIITEFEDDGSYVRFNYDRYYNGILHKLEYASIKCEAMANYTTGKLMVDGSESTWWQEYLMGTDPNNTNDFFTVNIAVTNDIPYLSWRPDLGSERLYLIMGVRNLDDEWELVDDLDKTDCKFFKIGVELP